MSVEEMGWRMHSAMRDVADRWRVAFDLRPDAPPTSGLAGVLPLCDLPAGIWNDAVEGSIEAAWRDRLLASANAALGHRLTFFNLIDQHLGDPIDWNRDHETGRRTPSRFAPSIDYRDVRGAGDAKVVWEPNRHHQLVVLGRAYRATGRQEFARAVMEQIASWIDQCPYGIGMNWRSPLELSIRVINWVWALDLIRPAGVLDAAFSRRMFEVLHLHLWDLTRKYSRGSSANNHLLGEAAGVFIATTCVPGLQSRGWREQSRQILCTEILRQTYEDGGTREQALSYELFVLQFALAALHAARGERDAFPPAVVSRIERMLEFLVAIGQAGPPPMFGDSDDGYVLDLGGRGSPAAVLALGGAILNRPDIAAAAGASVCEPACWVGRATDGFLALCGAQERRGAPLRPHRFEHTGLYLLQSGEQHSTGSISVSIDAAELGFGPLAAHGHADALSFTLRAGGRDILVDPGTYDYFTNMAWRDYFRSTRAHNAVVIDDTDQSVMLGPFMWGDRASCRVLAWEPTDDGGRILAEHDGYTRLADPVIHRRGIVLNGRERAVTIAEELRMEGEHEVALYFQLAEVCEVVGIDGHTVTAATGGDDLVVFTFDRRLRVVVLHGSTAPLGGWISRGYHRRAPVSTISASARLTGNQTLVTTIRLGASS